MADQTALITGSSSGIGRATAAQFLDEGWDVVATARDTDDVADLAAAGALPFELDVADPEEPAAGVEFAVEKTGTIDCLVNNAGYGQYGAVEDVPTRKVRKQFDVNVLGPHRLLRAALPHMREAGDGTVVNVSSVAGRVPVPGMGVYCGSKSALEAMSDALRPEVERFGVDVVLIEPGPVETAFRERAGAEEPSDRTGAYDGIYAVGADSSAVSDAFATEPETVATAIVDAATRSNPPARIPVGVVGRYGALARFVPDRLRDAAFRAVERLTG